MLKSIFMFLVLFCSSNIYSYSPDFIVGKDSASDFTSIQEALDAVPVSGRKQFIIFIKNGTYNEKIFIEKSNIVLIGEDRDSTKILYAELRSNWRKNYPGDYGSAVVNLKNEVHDICFMNLTIYNNYGNLYGNHDHQFAVRGGEGVTKIIVYNCNVIAGGGDTVSLWNTSDGMYFHRNCYFEGYVDYVCPRGYCYIDSSRFYGYNLTASIWHDGSGNYDHKFVIRDSYFDGVPGFPLGRHHRDGQFFLVNCTFSRNMADKEIFFAPSDPPRILQWGDRRKYFYNCHGETVDYPWHSDNLHTAEGSPAPEEITAEWTFNNSWDPVSVIGFLIENN